MSEGDRFTLNRETFDDSFALGISVSDCLFRLHFLFPWPPFFPSCLISYFSICAILSQSYLWCCGPHSACHAVSTAAASSHFLGERRSMIYVHTGLFDLLLPTRMDVIGFIARSLLGLTLGPSLRFSSALIVQLLVFGVQLCSTCHALAASTSPEIANTPVSPLP